MSFDLSGPLHITRRSDGLYVVGEGMLMAVDSYQEGLDIIKQEQERATRSS